MLKFLRTKLQSLTETQLNILTAVLVLINIGIIIFWISFFISLPKPAPLQIEEKPPLVEETPEEFKGGEVGETTETEEREVLPLPQVIFNTSGIILEVKADRLVAQGSGSNFADQKPRELTIIFTDSTTIFKTNQKVRYQGLDGLKYLTPGMEISIEGAENIRGKNEFRASIINIL